MITGPHPDPTAATSTATARHSSTPSQEFNAMLLYEILARTRMREDQHHASQARLAGRLAAVRRWQRIARYAERQARRAAARI